MERGKWVTIGELTALLIILVVVNSSCIGAWWWLVNQPSAEVAAVTVGKGSIKIGLAVDTTHYSGKYAVMGAQLAAEEINKYGTGGPLNSSKGGVKVGDKRLPVEILVEETGEMTQPGTERTIQAVIKLIKRGANVIMGGYATEETALEVCCRYKTIYMCTMSGEDRITAHYSGNPEKYKYVFNVLTNETINYIPLKHLLAHLKEEYGFSKVAVIAEEYEWVDPYLEGLHRDADQIGIEIVYEVRFPSTITTFMPYLTKAREAGAQVIVGIIALDWGLTFIKEWNIMKYGLAVGIVLPAQRETCWEETGGHCKYFIARLDGIPVANISDWYIHEQNAFKEKYGEKPMYTGTVTYTAVYLFCRAVEIAGTLETEAVISALKNIDTDTPGGYFKFNSNQGAYGWPLTPFTWAQWLGPHYAPVVYAYPDPFNGRTLKAHDIVLPPDEDPSWEIPGYTPG